MSYESDESDEKEYDRLGSESGSDGTFGNGLGGFLCSLGFTSGVMISTNESCGGDIGSLALT